MNIFHSTRIKLTAWYLLIIMTVSLSFSFFVYRNVIGEVNRGFRIRSLRTSFVTNEYLEADRDLYEAVRNRIIAQLGLVNGIIFALSATAGYFLAEKTLQPIEKMVDEQRRFIGDASHELRTPLTSLKTEIEVNLRDKGLSLKDARSLLQSNLEEVNKMESLSNYLLSLNRYESSEKNLPKESVYLNEVIEKVINRFEKTAQGKEIILKNNLQKISVRVNQTSIEELVSILLDNSLKYTPSSGRVTLKLYEKGKNAILSVSDTGIGIKSGDIPFIFNRFYRADTSRSKTRADGYGLGLAIARSIVSDHRGKIEVSSVISKGTTFKITLPK